MIEKYISVLFSYFWMGCVGIAIGNNTVPHPKDNTIAFMFFTFFSIVCVISIVGVIYSIHKNQN